MRLSPSCFLRDFIPQIKFDDPLEIIADIAGGTLFAGKILILGIQWGVQRPFPQLCGKKKIGCASEYMKMFACGWLN